MPRGFRPTAPPLFTLTHAEVLEDLDGGWRRHPRVPVLDAPVAPAVSPGRRVRGNGSRPRLTGAGALVTWLVARAVGRLHPRLARPFLWRLWFTPRVVRRQAVALPPAARPRRFVAAGRRVDGFELGTGPAVLLVHGWGGRSTDLATLAQDLAAAGFRAVALDLPAHGDSPVRRVDLFTLGRAVAEVLPQVGRVHAIVAHSLGFPAIVLALEELAGEGSPLPGTVVAIGAPRRLSSAADRFAARARLRPALIRELRRLLEGQYGADVWARLDAGRLGSLPVTGLLVHDHDDREVPFAEATELAAAWDVEVVATSGLGHRRILEDAEVRARVVAELSATVRVPAPSGSRTDPAASRPPSRSDRQAVAVGTG